ncbi:tRNA (adenosine(37)-N6)-threonylcarbamoyltransferase complex ATPase subunit type 1 TsaE [Kineococcus sp. T13]|uniref:tRNA (adenosine(37)-N6)-threonylcarbamoyltransferase complex ATPase subunit type 1 TsaE n=1 Tax=Kineococcus vitellinus TaxID=2696565 RepID=UPI001412F788|nr:tRNA (adenosine(37)-N6)-threonylcarbamoyltransferase complex ATPase subunit type 1 TsaE [Kineococcus vitellinus]
MSALELVLAGPRDTAAFGARLGALLRAGDLLVLAGDLGAGKTTLTRGLAEGLGVRGPVTSPTFVIARVHPSLRGGPPLVHVDAYRLGSLAEVDDLDLDASAEEAVTVVEWGRGLVEELAGERLEVDLLRPHGASAAASDEEPVEPRTVRLRGVGARWAGLARDLGPRAGADPA